LALGASDYEIDPIMPFLGGEELDRLVIFVARSCRLRRKRRPFLVSGSKGGGPTFQARS
jgi:hypothetical protein